MPRKPRNDAVLKKVDEDIEELTHADKNELLRIVLYEANDEGDRTERLLHTLKWLAAQQVELNDRLQRASSRLNLITILYVIGAIGSAVGAVASVIGAWPK